MDIDASIMDFDCYYRLEKLAEMAGITSEGLRTKLGDLSYMDKSDRPLEKLLKSKTSDYRFYAEEGHLEGEWHEFGMDDLVF